MIIKHISKYTLFLVAFLLILSITSCQHQKSSLKPTPESSTLEQATFKFVVLGDNRPSSPTEPQPEVFGKLISLVNQEKPSFVVHTGDLVAGKTVNADVYRRQYKDFLAIAENLRAPLYTTVGNHDVDNSFGQQLYQQLVREELYYSFNYKNSHFIILDTDIAGSPGEIEKTQLAWLKKELRTNKKADHIFVFMHRPLYSVMNPEGAPTRHISFTDKNNEIYLKQLMKNYRVRAVFAGHEHFFSKLDQDGVTYIITGSAGAPPYTDENHGGFPHYVAVEVGGKKIKLTVVKSTGERINPDSIPKPAF